MHIVLHPTHVTSLTGPNRPPRVDKLQKVRALAFPLNQVLIMQAGDSPYCEVTLISNLSMSWICAELWGDVIAAMEKAKALTRVQLTEAIIEGIKAEEVQQAPPPHEPRPRPAEGTRANPIRPTLRKPDAVEVAPEPSPHPDCSCGDFAGEDPACKAHQPDALQAVCNANIGNQGTGVTLPLPASSRRVESGDLRIAVSGSWFEVQIAERSGDTFEWGREDLPKGLRGTFSNFASAAQAIRVAGLAHRLIDAEEDAA